MSGLPRFLPQPRSPSGLRGEVYMAWARPCEAGTLCVLLNISWYAYHGEDQNNLYMAAAPVGLDLIRQMRLRAEGRKASQNWLQVHSAGNSLASRTWPNLGSILGPRLLFGSLQAAPQAASRCHFTGEMSCRKLVAALSAEHTAWMSFQVDAVAEASWYRCILPAFRLRWPYLARAVSVCDVCAVGTGWAGLACGFSFIAPKRAAGCHVQS